MLAVPGRAEEEVVGAAEVAGVGSLLGDITLAELLELAKQRASENLKDEGDAPGQPEAAFRKLGENWMLRYDGKTIYVKARIGMDYIANVLTDPGRSAAVTSLQSGVAPMPCDSRRNRVLSDTAVSASNDAGAGEMVTDANALRECRERLRDVEGEIEQAKEEGNEGLACKLREERAQLMDYVRAGTGLRGRLRRVANARERARKSVTNAIARAISAISQHHETLGRHLRNAVRTGYRVVYDPEKPVNWDV